MTHRSFKLTSFVCGVWIAVFLAACGNDPDYKSVDFTRKIPTSQVRKSENGARTLRVAVGAMISPKETLIHYRKLLDYLGDKVNHSVVLVQRRTYGEINELLFKGQIDLAFICTGPFVTANTAGRFQAIATPIISGEPVYRAYLIVHRDSPMNTLADLEGKRFAFTDPESNTGSLVPKYWLRRIDRDPESFFRERIYTYSHDNSILSVAKRLVDGAAVDSHIWDFYQKNNDRYSGKTRVIQTSEPFGSPPLVVSHALDSKVSAALAEVILTMHEDPQGSEILSELMIERFTPPKAEWYLPVGRMISHLREGTARDDSTP